MDASILWIAAMVVLLIIEGLTANLTTVWFAVGALAAAIATNFTDSAFVQWEVFLVASTVSLVATRPLVKKMNLKKQATNADSLVGKKARVTSDIDNSLETGSAFIDGKEWTARSIDGQTLKTGEFGEVVKIDGVKLIIKKDTYKEEET